MSLVMIATRIFSVSTGQKVSAKTRYMMWIILLLGAMIPIRPVIGTGLITLPNNVVETISSPADDEIYINTTVETSEEEVGTSSSSQEKTLPTKGFQMPSTVQIIVFLWAAGAILFFGKYMLEYAKFYRLIRRWGNPVSDQNTLEIYKKVCEKMGLEDKRIGLIRCDFISTPMLTGLLKPAILLPKNDIDEEEMSLILEHELTHYLHKDLWVNLLSIVVICIHWFNPLVYLCLPTIYGDGESYCDETVLKNRDTDYRRFYGEVIISIIQHSSNKPIALSTCFYEKKINIKRRLYNIMEKNKNRKAISIAAIAGVSILTIISGSVLVFANQGKSEAVSLNTAKQIALKHAKLKEQEVFFVQAKKDIENGREVYDIEFYANNVEYDYEIDVKTGKILSFDVDHDD